MKTLNYLLYRAFLPPEVAVPDDLVLGHLAMGVVVHQHVDLGRGVLIWQGVQFVSDAGGDRADSRIVVGDDVEIGAAAILVGRIGRTLRIGSGSRIGAGAVVTKDVAPGAVVVGQESRIIDSRKP